MIAKKWTASLFPRQNFNKNLQTERTLSSKCKELGMQTYWISCPFISQFIMLNNACDNERLGWCSDRYKRVINVSAAENDSDDDCWCKMTFKLMKIKIICCNLLLSSSSFPFSSSVSIISLSHIPHDLLHLACIHLALTEHSPSLAQSSHFVSSSYSFSQFTVRRRRWMKKE